MAQVGLNRSRIGSLVRQVVAAAMTQHMGVCVDS